MPLVRSPIARPARQFSDCPGCGRDLTGVYVRALFCPSCGKHLNYKGHALRRASLIVWDSLLEMRFWQSRWRGGSALDVGGRTPIVIGYGNALFKLGWRYERAGSASRNLPEAIRCYRKSARLGNLDAAVRLVVDEGEPQPKAVIPLGDQDC